MVTDDSKELAKEPKGLNAYAMRLDAFLKQTGLVKRRPIAKLMCDGNKVQRNGHNAKAGDDVRMGDVLRISYGTRIVEAEITEVPKGNVAKGQRDEFFRITHEEKIADDF
jgi:ribosomal 50S subunit-recycling heat shock protein